MFTLKKRYKIIAVFKNYTTTIMSNHAIDNMESGFVESAEKIINETNIYPVIGDTVFANGYNLNINSRIINGEYKLITYHISHVRK